MIIPHCSFADIKCAIQKVGAIGEQQLKRADRGAATEVGAIGE